MMEDAWNKDSANDRFRCCNVPVVFRYRGSYGTINGRSGGIGGCGRCGEKVWKVVNVMEAALPEAKGRNSRAIQVKEVAARGRLKLGQRIQYDYVGIGRKTSGGNKSSNYTLVAADLAEVA
jgi:hypothetical protein